ncbi:hypothetical protein F5146DRAFT_72909 [Armillaria mellea]|nr:hypothetical protein F5146DRAFT_72909 [Armillaria mellea]
MGMLPSTSLQVGLDLCRYSPISFPLLYGPDSNGTRAMSVLSCLDTQLGIVHSSAIYLRLAEKQELVFPKLQKLNVSMHFVADTSILSFLAGSLLDDVSVTFPSGCRRCHGLHLCGSKSIYHVLAGWKKLSLTLRNTMPLHIESHSTNVNFFPHFRAMPHTSRSLFPIASCDGFYPRILALVSSMPRILPRSLNGLACIDAYSRT